MDDPKKIQIMQTRRIVNKDNVTTVPTITNLIADAIGTIELEIIKFRAKVQRGQSLDTSEARTLTGYVKALTELDKMRREFDKEAEQNLSKMSDEELINLLNKKK